MWSPTIDSHLQNFELYYQYATARAWYQTRTSLYMKYPFVPNDWPVVGEVAKYRTGTIKENNIIKLSDSAPHVSSNSGLKDAWIFEKWGKRRPKLGRLNITELTYRKPEESIDKINCVWDKIKWEKLIQPTPKRFLIKNLQQFQNYFRFQRLL